MNSEHVNGEHTNRQQRPPELQEDPDQLSSWQKIIIFAINVFMAFMVVLFGMFSPFIVLLSMEQAPWYWTTPMLTLVLCSPLMDFSILYAIHRNPNESDQLALQRMRTEITTLEVLFVVIHIILALMDDWFAEIDIDSYALFFSYCIYLKLVSHCYAKRSSYQAVLPENSRLAEFHKGAELPKEAGQFPNVDAFAKVDESPTLNGNSFSAKAKMAAFLGKNSRLSTWIHHQLSLWQIFQTTDILLIVVNTLLTVAATLLASHVGSVFPLEFSHELLLTPMYLFVFIFPVFLYALLYGGTALFSRLASRHPLAAPVAVLVAQGIYAAVLPLVGFTCYEIWTADASFDRLLATTFTLSSSIYLVAIGQFFQKYESIKKAYKGCEGSLPGSKGSR